MKTQDIKIDQNFQSGSGISSTISWARMEDVLRASGELKSHERISGYTLTDNGLQYYVKRVNEV